MQIYRNKNTTEADKDQVTKCQGFPLVKLSHPVFSYIMPSAVDKHDAGAWGKSKQNRNSKPPDCYKCSDC